MNVPEIAPETTLAPGEGPLAEELQQRVLTALERIQLSEEFSGSAQLSRFLRYVVRCGLSGEVNLLKESTVGLAVFNRGPGYDPKVDPIVRVEARRLRARLEAYYSRDGAGDEVRIGLPKGGYIPSFEFESVQKPALPDAPAESPESRKTGFTRTWLLAAVLSVAVGVAAFASLALRQSPTASADPVRVFWTSFLDSDRPVMVVPADSALVLVQDLAHEPVSLNEYLTGEYRARLAPHIPLDLRFATDLGQRRYTSIADLEFAIRLSHRREAARLGIVTRFARDVRVEDVKHNNLVLLGARHSNPWVELFEGSSTFRLQHDEQSSSFTVINTQPAQGEAARIEISPADLRKEIYAVVTYHGNEDGSGRVLTVAGTSVAGTEAAADFLLDDARLRPWLKRATVHGEVRGFDVLLHDRNLSGSAPQADVVAFHIGR
jgi:hypothetical protein